MGDDRATLGASEIRQSWMFNPEAEDHYSGSIVIINHRANLGASVQGRMQRDYSTFVGRIGNNNEALDGEVRENSLVRNQYTNLSAY